MLLKDLPIPVVAEGRVVQMTAEEVLLRRDIADLAYADRLIRAAMVRHLVVWAEVGIPDIGVDEYAQYPLAEVPGVKTVEVSKLHLVHHSTQDWFSDRKEGNPPMHASEALPLLLACHLFGNYRSQALGSISPLPRKYQLPVASTLHGVIDIIRTGLAGQPKGSPMWECDIAWDAPVMPLTGWLNHLTLAPHRIQLLFDANQMVSHAVGKEVKVDKSMREGFQDHLAYPHRVSFDTLAYVSMDAVFVDSAAHSEMQNHPEFTGWEVAALVTGDKGEVRGVCSTRSMMYHGAPSQPRSYAERWHIAKSLTTNVSKMAAMLATKQSDALHYDFFRGDDVAAMFHKAATTRTSAVQLMHDVASLLLNTLDDATVRANPASWADDRIAKGYVSLRRRLYQYIRTS